MMFVVLDIETSGLQIGYHEPTEIAALGVEDGRVVSEFNVRCKIDMKKADPEALKVNHFDPDLWAKEGKDPLTVISQLNAFFKAFADIPRVSKAKGMTFYTTRVVGHNIIRFDVPFLQAWLKGYKAWCNIDLVEQIDTVQVALVAMLMGKIKPPNFQLKTLCEVAGIRQGTVHSAVEDAMSCFKLYQFLINKMVAEKPKESGNAN